MTLTGIINYLESRGVTVRAIRGGWQPCKCPYHEDRTASASVSADRNRFHCFACDINEDLIGLIRLDTGAGYAEAKQEAAQKYGEVTVTLGEEPSRSGLLSGLKRNHGGNRAAVSSWRSSLP